VVAAERGIDGRVVPAPAFLQPDAAEYWTPSALPPADRAPHPRSGEWTEILQAVATGSVGVVALAAGLLTVALLSQKLLASRAAEQAQGART